MKYKERAKKLILEIPTLYMTLKKKETPILAKIFAGITIAYALSPIDFIPDFIPVLGYIDDIIILPILIVLTIKFIPDEILKQCRVEAEILWKEGKPVRWYYTIPIILLWIVILLILLKIIF